MMESEDTKPALPPRTTSLTTFTEENESLSPTSWRPTNPQYSPQPPSKFQKPTLSKVSIPPVKQRRPMPPPKPQVYDNLDQNEPMETTDGLLKSLGHLNKGRAKSPSLDTAPIETFSPVAMKVGEVLQLADFVKKYSQVLPLRVKVEEGYCGAEERFIISTGDIYNLHFIKNEKVVSIKDCGGNHFAIPLNSSIEFGLLYDPVNDFKQAVKGYLFKTVAELANYKIHPLVIRSSKAYDSGDPKTSVQADEVLIVQKTGKTAVKRKHFIKVMNVRTGEEKTLYEDCEGHFLTGPYNVRMYLPEILQHFGHSFPLDAMLYVDSHSSDEPSDDLPLRLTTDKVVLSHTSIESSIIASTCWELAVGAEPSEEDRIPVAIPINLDIEIAILEEYEDDRLYEDTKTLFETFDPTKIKTMELPPRTGAPNSAQKKLYRATRLGVNGGLEISRPSKIYDEPVLPPCLSGNEESSTELPFFQSSLSEVLKRKPQSYLSPTDKSPSKSFTPPSSSSPVGSPPMQSPVSPSVARKPYEKHVVSASKDAQHKPNVKTKPYERTSIKSGSKEDNQRITEGKLSESYPPTLTNTSLPQFSDLHSQMKSLKSLFDATQDNSRRQMSGLRTEVARVSSAMEEMKMKYQLLLEEVQQLRQQLATVEKSHRQDDSRPHTQSMVAISGTKYHMSFPGVDSVLSRDNRESLSVSPYSGRRGGSMVVTEAQMEENKQFLETLDHVQILNVLEAMHLKAYQDIFRVEQIDGAILRECDDGVLEQELNIKNKLHRNKILKLIKGRYSAAKILDGGDPYVSFEPSH